MDPIKNIYDYENSIQPEKIHPIKFRPRHGSIDGNYQVDDVQLIF